MMEKTIDLPEPELEQEDDDDALIAPPSSTDTTPLRLRSGSISDGRARSNPRLNRNNMRWDSPLATTPNRLRLEEENREKRTTIRLHAGSTGIGLSTVRLSSRVVDDRRNKPRSSKQSRPSVRKLRRWDNDNFVGAASELAMAGTPEAADIFLKAQAEKGKYLMANYPLQYRSVFKKLLEDSSLQDVRERFVNGEVAHDDPISKPLTAKALFKRMNPRLRKIICSSANTDHLHLVDSYESYLQSIFSKPTTTPTIPPVLSATLVDTPVIKKESNTTRIIFEFPNNKTAAFSRLLLHAVCDFHDLQSVSSSGEEENKLLTVSGTYFHYPQYHLSHVIAGKDTSSKVVESVPISLEGSMSLLKVSS